MSHDVRGRPGRGHLVSGVGTLAVVLAMLSVAVPGAGASDPSWHVQATPNPPGAAISVLSSVSCPHGAVTCTAVGSSSRTPSTSTRVLAERWDGTRWRIQPTTTPAGTSDTMYGVSCASSNACVAVGSAFHLTSRHTTPLAESWNGSVWRVLATPTVGSTAWLTAVACSAPSACTGVGVFHDAAGTQALVERWNGTSWRLQAAARPATSTQLEGVSCPGATTCVAVGSQSAGSTRPLAESWNGTRWQAQTVPMPSGATGGYLSAVSCSSPSACTGTGTDFRPGGITLAERWNGTSWRVQATPNPSDWRLSFRSTELDGVACASASTCTASGEYAPHGSAAYFVETWNGRAWTLVTVPHPAGYQHGALLSMSCSTTRCTAVGADATTTVLQATLAVGN